MIISVDQHERNFEQRARYLEMRRLQLAGLQDDVDKIAASLQILRAQIVRARNEGRAAFDEDVFNKPRRKRS